MTDDNAKHFLLVGDSADLPRIEATIARLPVDAYGQIIVEVASELQIQRWDVPEGITVTWLCRDRFSLDRAGVAPRGALAAAAVSAWVSEWMPDDHWRHTLPYILWIGCAQSPLIDELYCDLAARLPHLHLHHPHADR